MDRQVIGESRSQPHPRIFGNMMQAYQRWAPAEAGLFDYGRLENR